ncbi:unnamed protein product [Darwinula stevensoni]|uniref:Uncharacterized protein n=1 Tax=Darwinula stevensoni TaxID=69355 RepID=A0A7R8XG45_9CRUS|nr:unnamed protein product [Darwinula stevensoni]CAG0889389.1 unnamed protein product [Darwinula stevensoni]
MPEVTSDTRLNLGIIGGRREWKKLAGITAGRQLQSREVGEQETQPTLSRIVRELLIQRNPRRSMRKMAREMHISGESMRTIVKKHIHLKSLKRMHAQLLPPHTRQLRLQRSKALLQRFTFDDVDKILFSDEKLFTIQATSNRQNDRILAPRISDVSDEMLIMPHSQHLQEEKVRNNIARIFKIWAERHIYDKDFLAVLFAILNDAKPEKISHSHSHELGKKVKDQDQDQDKEKEMQKPILESFEPENLISKIASTHAAHKVSGEKHRKMKSMCFNMAEVEKFHLNIKGKIKAQEKKLEEVMTSLPEGSPVPSPDVNAPSPGPEDDFDLEDDKSSSSNLPLPPPSSLKTSDSIPSFFGA